MAINYKRIQGIDRILKKKIKLIKVPSILVLVLFTIMLLETKVNIYEWFVTLGLIY